jgi:hypothetical protein
MSAILGAMTSTGVAVHDIGVALGGDQGLGRLALAAGVDDGSDVPALTAAWVRADRVLESCSNLPSKSVKRSSVHSRSTHLQPFGGAGVAVVVLVELQAVAAWPLRPPGRDDVQRQTAARDRSILAASLWRTGLAGGSSAAPRPSTRCFEVTAASAAAARPGVQSRLLDALDVVEIQLGDQGQVIADLSRSFGSGATVCSQVAAMPSSATFRSQPPKTGASNSHTSCSAPPRLRLFGDVPTSHVDQPSCGSKPSTSSGLATKFDRPLMS